MPLEIGDKAPVMDVTIDTGDKINLASIYAKGTVLVYFYPKADTPGCTLQGCNLRDNMSALNAAGMSILGVSADTAAAQAAFKEKYKFGFTLVADERREMINAFGVQGRQSFIVKDGKIAWVQPKATPKTQAEDAVKALRELS